MNIIMCRVDTVVSRINSAGLELRPEKCHLLQTEVTFLGYILSKDGVRPELTNVAKVADWSTPSTAKQVKQFVSIASYYRRFIKALQNLSNPLTELTYENVVNQMAFESLKANLTGDGIIGYPLNEVGD
jgi:hypothetical protein